MGFRSGGVGAEPDPGGTPAAALLSGGPLPGGHFGKLVEKLVNALAQGPDAFSVHDAHGKNAMFNALGEIVRQQIGDLGGQEGVQIQLIRDGKRNRLVVAGVDFL
jgi:hypothetical protein